jgi:Family of unknown function (DUF5675)
MTTIYLDRNEYTDKGTLGTLNQDSTLLCYTLELPWNNNESGTSCIPNGEYQVIPHNSFSHPNTWEITGVPDREAILIHNGNTEADSKGCVLVGDSTGEINGKPAVLNSKATLNKLRGILPDNFTLVISDV